MATTMSGEGFDTVVYDRPRDDYSVQFSDTFVMVTDLVGNGGSDPLFEIERISFADGEILL